ncbi:MAG: amidohydrolase family protein, partial [Crenarchaeota archaeon]|nr:amidohydrolase family protein [Thermoproteota archaeon]
FHCSETIEQREESIKKFGVSDISRALELNLDFDFVIHLNYAEDEELALLAQKNKLITFCPRANLYLGLKPPPIADAIELSIPFALGTDNIMLNSPDIFRELETAVRLSRIQGATPDPKQLLSAVTATPSKALKLKTGIIDIGYQADFFVFDLAKPNVAFVGDIYKTIVLRGSEMNVIQTYIAGKPVLSQNEPP